MSKARVALGLDAGSSSLKASAIDIYSGERLKGFRRPYKEDSGVLCSGAISLKRFEDAVSSLLDDAQKEFELSAIGLSTQMYSICIEEPGGIFVLPWNSPWEADTRAAEVMKRFYPVTGCPPKAMFPLYKLLSRQGEGFRFLPYGLKGALSGFLTGQRSCDLTTAGSSGFTEYRARRWNRELIRSLGLKETELPSLTVHTAPAGTCRGAVYANALGDGPSASYACLHLGRFCANLGTSVAVRTITAREEDLLPGSLWRYAVDGRNCVVGDVSAAGCGLIEQKRAEGSLFEGSPVYRDVAFTVLRMAEAMRPEPEDVLVLAGGGVFLPDLMKILTRTIPLKMAVLKDGEYLAADGAAASALKAAGFDTVPRIELDRVLETEDEYASEYEAWKKNQEG